jgi:hypothetical protein
LDLGDRENASFRAARAPDMCGAEKLSKQSKASKVSSKSKRSDVGVGGWGGGSRSRGAAGAGEAGGVAWQGSMYVADDEWEVLRDVDIVR